MDLYERKRRMGCWYINIIIILMNLIKLRTDDDDDNIIENE